MDAAREEAAEFRRTAPDLEGLSRLRRFGEIVDVPLAEIVDSIVAT